MVPTRRSTVARLFLALPIALQSHGGDLPAQGERVFELPFPAGVSFVCLRSPGGELPPGQEEALREVVDFALPEGAPVVASAAGRVVEVMEDFHLSGADPRVERFANRVVIDHGAGLFTRYLHLAPNSVEVAEGDYVRAGQRIARSGHTGRTLAPKLRFFLGDLWGRPLPVRFAELKDGLPVEKKRCLSKNRDQCKLDLAAKKKPPSRFGGATREQPPPAEEAPAQPETSTLPAEAFAFNGVTLTCALPANVYEQDWTYVITGRVTNDAKRVSFFLTKRDSGECSAFFIAHVTAQKTFALFVRLADQADKLAEGPFKYALTTVPADGNFVSAKMLPLVIAK